MYFKVHSLSTQSVRERVDWMQKIEIEKWYQQTQLETEIHKDRPCMQCPLAANEANQRW